MRVLLLNGAVRGNAGDSHVALQQVRDLMPDDDVTMLTLAEHTGTIEDVVALVEAADAFVLGTGTYWGSWGSPLQRFLEVMTPHEASALFVGKPVAAVVTMDSVGGVDVGLRLLGAFTLLGCLVPPFPLVVLSRVGSAVRELPGFDDVWQLKDLAVLVDNLRACSDLRARFSTWPIEKARTLHGPWPHGGALDLGLPRTLVDDDG